MARKRKVVGDVDAPRNSLTRPRRRAEGGKQESWRDRIGKVQPVPRVEDDEVEEKTPPRRLPPWMQGGSETPDEFPESMVGQVGRDDDEDWAASLPAPTEEELAAAAQGQVQFGEVLDPHDDMLWDWVRQDRDGVQGFLGVVPTTHHETQMALMSAGSLRQVISDDTGDGAKVVGMFAASADRATGVVQLRVYVTPLHRERLPVILPLIQTILGEIDGVRAVQLQTESPSLVAMLKSAGFTARFVMQWDVPGAEGVTVTPAELPDGDVDEVDEVDEADIHRVEFLTGGDEGPFGDVENSDSHEG